ncbi:S8 family serine peptidase, partial [Candidatus Fermentibacteria bacterium]|nr:S8 family serine peptidase [Candidatus Fermentibacteria bacterium]
MREWLLILCLGAAVASSTGADEVCWVLFSDKGEAADADGLARTSLSARCLARRAKVRGEAARLIDEEDLQVSERYVEAVAERGALIRHRSRWFNAVSVEADRPVLDRLAALPFVWGIRPIPRYVRSFPEPLRAGCGVPDYGAAEAQLAQIRVPYLHALGYTGSGVLVCLLDTGFYKDHESLRDLHLVAERDFVFGDGDTQRDPANPQDYSDAHGTAVWSALAGYRPGALVGPAHGASFLLAKTEDLRYELPIEEDNWVAAIEWADSAGADVVSSSLCYTIFDNGMGYTYGDLDGNTAMTTIAADRAAELGIAVVVAAGNYRGTSWGTIGTPADGDSVIAVGAVDASGAIGSFSSPGPTADGRIKPEVCARG